MAHRSEKGSVIGFVLVGTALAAAFVGGVYMVRHSGELNSVDTQQTAQTSQSETVKNDQKTRTKVTTARIQHRSRTLARPARAIKKAHRTHRAPLLAAILIIRLRFPIPTPILALLALFLAALITRQQVRLLLLTTSCRKLAMKPAACQRLARLTMCWRL